METLLQTVEFYATLASLHVDDYTYPWVQLEDIWRDVMLNQFHDILPGTSIKLAIDDALEIYEKRFAETHALLETTLQALLPKSQPSTNLDAHHTIALDPFRMARTEIVELNIAQERHYAAVQVGNKGVGTIADSQAFTRPTAYSREQSHVLENGSLRLTISNGRVTSLRDLSLDRELILPGPRAVDGGLMIYEDLPLEYDAWDMEIYHLDCATILEFDEVSVGEVNSLRASLEAISRFGSSTVLMTVSQHPQFEAYNSSPSMRLALRLGLLYAYKYMSTGTRNTNS